MLFFLSIYALGLVAFGIHAYALPPSARTSSKLWELFLQYQIVFSIGVTSIVAFFALTYMDQYIADYTHWPACPFQQQLANVNLAFGILGILCLWMKDGFWIATIVGFSIWIMGDGFHHLYHYLFYGNASAGNIGVPFWTDVVVPPLLLTFLWFQQRASWQDKIQD
jgi:hypothetical protein